MIARSAIARWLVLALVVALTAPCIAAAPREEGGAALRIGLASDVRSIDPHRGATQADATVAAHVFESLVTFDGRARAMPLLATSWTTDGDRTWDFTLRRGVRFHDDSELTSDDVVASIERASRLHPEQPIGGEPGTLTVTAVDRSTVRVSTAAPYPALLQDLAAIRIASARSIRAEGPGDRATMLAGTGPYRLVSADAGTVKLEAYTGYRGGMPAWPSVTLRGLADARERVEQLEAGRVDVMERPPLDALDRLRADPRFAVHQAASGRLMYLQFGMHRSDPPGVRVGDRAVHENPLLDRRVRRAISESIDRIELVKIVKGLGAPAGQLVPPGFAGHAPGLEGDARNLSDAHSLLAESGYPNGFALTLHGPRDVYPGDQALLAAIARMLADVGIRVEAVATPAATFAADAARQRYSAYIRGFTPSLRDGSIPLRALLATFDRHSGAGSLNWGRYSNGTLDGMIYRAMAQRNDDERDFFVQEATRLALKDVAIVPLYFAYEASVGRADLDVAARPDALLVASSVTRRDHPRRDATHDEPTIVAR